MAGKFKRTSQEKNKQRYSFRLQKNALLAFQEVKPFEL
jgi:hypothetical protein